MGYEFLYALWFFLPAGFANATPVFVSRWPILKDWSTPIDFGLTIHGHRLLGDNKTWRGLLTATIVATFLFMLQQGLASHLGGFSVYLHSVNYSSLPLILGPLLGLGALLGDAGESYLKRLRGIKPGHSWFPYDQLDYIIGACILAAPVTVLPVRLYIWIVFVWLLMHLIFAYLGFLLHLKTSAI